MVRGGGQSAARRGKEGTKTVKEDRQRAKDFQPSSLWFEVSLGWRCLWLEVSLVRGEGQGAARRSKEGHGRMVFLVLSYTFLIDAQCIHINPKQH